MTIGIDCRLAGIENAGIGRYIEELVREVIKDTTITWVLFFQKPHQLTWLEKKDHVRIVIAPVRHYTFQEQLQMPSIFSKEKVDLLHVPHFNIPLLYPGPFVVTIHDLLWHNQRGENMTTLSPLVYSLKYHAYKWVSSSAIKRSRAVLVPARTVKDTILTHIGGIDERKIHVTYEGVDAQWFGTEKRKAHKEKILFYTGSLYPHKNVMLVVQALKELTDYHLYISSSRNVFVDTFMKVVAEMGMTHRVTHVGRLSDEELRVWYHKSAALVQPSLSEGFGLTGVEALAAGIPVIASDIPIFREIYKDAFIPFDPIYSQSFVEAVKKLENMNTDALIERGKRLAHAYSWSTMAQETLSLYKSVLKG